ncbi:hypothetical protein DFS34DRAFT_648350 [Phlyctochytrium arcticum]|nr:hypothetical protein DFS34DRAFT_648350 [Phlyctochytrium arcticum]
MPKAIDTARSKKITIVGLTKTDNESGIARSTPRVLLWPPILAITDLLPLRRYCKILDQGILSSVYGDGNSCSEQLVVKKIAQALFPPIHYLGDSTRAFLVDMFPAVRTIEEWETLIDTFVLPETWRIIHFTLPAFLKAFALVSRNPLMNRTTWECEHLNSYVHPLLERSLWACGGIHHKSGELIDKFTVRTRGDGVGYLVGLDDLPLLYLEGSKPYYHDSKEALDAAEIAAKARDSIPWLENVEEDAAARAREILHVRRADDRIGAKAVVGASVRGRHLYAACVKWAQAVKGVANDIEAARKHK